MFWIALICFLIAVVGAVVLLSSEDRFAPGVVTGVAAVAGFLFLIASMVSFVPTRNVGIVTSYGKATGRTTGAGMQWTKPWEGIDDWDATRQSYDHLDDACTNPQQRDGLWATIAGQRNACIRVQVNWETTTTERATENWATYRERDNKSRFEVFTAAQVIPGINSAVLATFRDFDPLALVDPKSGEAVAPDLAGTYTARLKAEILANLGSDIKVMGIAWGPIGYDQVTTNLIAGRAQKVLESRNLAIDKTNADLRKSIAGTSGVPAAVQQCLDLVKTLNKGEPGLCMGGQVALTKPIG
jgi:hypothetical protein